MQAFRTVALVATALVVTGCLEYPARNRPLCRPYDSRLPGDHQGFREQLKAKFRRHDVDGDGRYNRDEFHRSDFAALLTLKDKNSDGLVSLAEYASTCELAGLRAEYAASCRKRANADFRIRSDGRNITFASSRNRILAAWPSNDLNNDGYVDVAELYGICD